MRGASLTAGWSPGIEVDLARWHNVKAYVDRVAARPKVREALQAEGLIQASAAAS